MIRIKILIISLSLICSGFGEVNYHPYLFKYNPDSLKILMDSLETVNEDNVRACTFWYNMWEYHCDEFEAIDMRTDYIVNNSIQDLNSYEVENVAIKQWNAIVETGDPLDERALFNIRNDLTYNSSVWIVQLYNNWNEYHENYSAPGITCNSFKSQSWSVFDENHTPYCHTYSNSTSDQNLVNNNKQTIIYINASDAGVLSFKFVDGEPYEYASPIEVNIQHIV